jgi:hypothetical protein
MSEEIDSVIASLKTDETLVKQTPEKVSEPSKVTDEPEQIEEKDDLEAESTIEDVPFPKKAVNALSRRDKQIAKLRAEMAAKDAELSKYRQIQTQPQEKSNPTDAPPSQGDFEDYSEYLEAKLLYRIKQEQKTQEDALKKQAESSRNQEWEATREREIAKSAETHKTQIPDFAQVIEEHADLADSFPPEIQRAFLEADDAALAYYNLAKEGTLESLATMSPYKAAMMIALAQTKKPTLNKITNASTPIKPLAGRGSSTKSFDDMSGEELLKKFNIKY